MESKELILILDFGGQYNQLIARRVRECNVYSEVVPFNISIEKIKEKNPKGIIFTGGPASVYGEESPKCADGIFELGIPVLGICYGMQLMAHTLGGKVTSATTREYGETNVNIDNTSPLFQGFKDTNIFLMSHTDYVEEVPQGFKKIGYTPVCPNAAMENQEKNLYGIQFHPEVNNSINGTQVIKNFLYNVCHCSGDWVMSSFVEDSIKSLKVKYLKNNQEISVEESLKKIIPKLKETEVFELIKFYYWCGKESMALQVTNQIIYFAENSKEIKQQAQLEKDKLLREIMVKKIISRKGTTYSSLCKELNVRESFLIQILGREDEDR